MNGLRKASLGSMLAAAALITYTSGAVASTAVNDQKHATPSTNITQSNNDGTNQANIIGDNNTVNQGSAPPSSALLGP